MSPFALSLLADEQLALARTTGSGRSARTLLGGPARLRQTLVALMAGHALEEHASPGDATLQVLRGRVRLVVEGRSWPGSAGDLLVIPDARHALHADEDAVVLLTVARG